MWVTGVQTCALPIYVLVVFVVAPNLRASSGMVEFTSGSISFPGKVLIGIRTILAQVDWISPLSASGLAIDSMEHLPIKSCWRLLGP